MDFSGRCRYKKKSDQSDTDTLGNVGLSGNVLIGQALTLVFKKLSQKIKIPS